MRILIVATSATEPGVEAQIAAGNHPRIDYLELARCLPADYLDYNTIQPASFRRVEEALRLDFRLALRAARLVQKNGYDTVFSMSERVGALLALLLRRRVKHVVQIAHPLSPLKLRIMRFSRVAATFHTIIVPTLAEAAELSRKLPAAAGQMRTLHYPIDTRFFHPDEHIRTEPEPEHIESLGLSYRDYPTLIRAIRQLPDVICYLRAGSTWVHHNAGFDREPLPENIHLKPIVTPLDLRQCYQRARFIVVPLQATTQWSAGCTTITQAIALGRAVIATHTPGIADYLCDGENGLLVAPSDPDALAEAIRDLWDHPIKVSALSRQSSQCADRFSLDNWLEQMAGMITG